MILLSSSANYLKRPLGNNLGIIKYVMYVCTLVDLKSYNIVVMNPDKNVLE